MTATPPGTRLVDLPTDILLTILPYLEPKEFLNFCSTSKDFAALKLEPSYWRHVTRSTYRTPNQPLLQTDGARWRSLYQRLRTENCAYTWGRFDYASRGGLGHTPLPYDASSDSLPRYASRNGVGWPTKMHGLEKLDPIVDLQCGGWSTTLLTSRGDLYATGIINAQIYLPANRRQVHPMLDRLIFPPHLPQGDDRIPVTTIAQFSSGRSHIVALSDAGTIWTWKTIDWPGQEVKFLHADLSEGTGMPAPNERNQAVRVKRVVGGWASSSAYVTGKGIVVWSLKQPTPRAGEPQNAHIWSVEDDIVPDTYYQRPRRQARESNAEEERLGKVVGEVMNHVVLEAYVVFVTDLGKVFAAKHGQPETLRQGLVELAHFEPSEGKAAMTEIQGSFRSFAVFNTDGDVVIGTQDLLDRAWERAFLPSVQAEVLLPVRPPALQNRGVISLAFGDWHKLVLTRDGRILSYGEEPSACGCLGLGTQAGEGPFRGVWYQENAWTQVMQGNSQGRWRQVWFSPEQREWLRYMSRGGIDPSTGLEQIKQMTRSAAARLAIADQIECNGGDWDLHPDLDDESQPWGRSEPAYLALSISAAGWHCGALVLTNQKKIHKMYESHAGFLPRVNSFQPTTTTSPTLLSSVWNWISSWLTIPGAAAAHLLGSEDSSSLSSSSSDSAVEDQLVGRDHAHYHSRDVSTPWTVLKNDLPDAARHEAFFPSVSTAAAE